MMPTGYRWTFTEQHFTVSVQNGCTVDGIEQGPQNFGTSFNAGRAAKNEG